AVDCVIADENQENRAPPFDPIKEESREPSPEKHHRGNPPLKGVDGEVAPSQPFFLEEQGSGDQSDKRPARRPKEERRKHLKPPLDGECPRRTEDGNLIGKKTLQKKDASEDLREVGVCKGNPEGRRPVGE